MSAVDDFLDEKPGPHYTLNQRYLLRLPGDPKPKARTRMTTFVKALDNHEGLVAWNTCMALGGMSREPALRAEWAALTAHFPNPYYDSDESKMKARDIAERAKKAGGGDAKRDMGTALHAILAAVVTGRTTIAQVDPEWRWHAEAVLAIIGTNGYRVIPEWSERSVYHDALDLCGTFDLLLEHTATRRLYIADLKTGGEMWNKRKDPRTGRHTGWYDAHEISDLTECAQLAGYASASHLVEWPYSPLDECVLTPMPVVDQSEGLVIHAPSTVRDVAIRRLNLSVGRDALELARQLRLIRREKALIGRIGSPPPPLGPVATAALTPVELAEGLDLLEGM